MADETRSSVENNRNCAIKRYTKQENKPAQIHTHSSTSAHAQLHASMVVGRQIDDQDQTERKTTEQTVHPNLPNSVNTQEAHGSVQSREISTNSSDQRLMTGPAVNIVDNNGPTQLGENSSIVYNITNNNHYHYPCPPFTHASGLCLECIQFHDNDHRPSGENHHVHRASEARRDQLQQQPLPQLLPNSERAELDGRNITLSGGDTNNPNQLFASEAPRQRPRQAISNGKRHASEELVKTSAAPRKERNDKKPKDCKKDPEGDNGNHVQSPTRRPQLTRAMAVQPENRTARVTAESLELQDNSTASLEKSNRVRNTVSILDTNGRPLEPGDPVCIGQAYNRKWAVYIGNQEVVRCVGGPEQPVVIKQTLDLTEPFRKYTARSNGLCRMFTPKERVENVTSRLGTVFTEGKGFVTDFPCWVITGMGCIQARNKGFSLWQS